MKSFEHTGDVDMYYGIDDESEDELDNDADILAIQTFLLKSHYNNDKKNLTKFLDYISLAMRDSYCKVVAYGLIDSGYIVIISSEHSLTIFRLSSEKTDGVMINQHKLKSFIRYKLTENEIRVYYKLHKNDYTSFVIKLNDLKMKQRLLKFLIDYFD